MAGQGAEMCLGPRPAVRAGRDPECLSEVDDHDLRSAYR